MDDHFARVYGYADLYLLGVSFVLVVRPQDGLYLYAADDRVGGAVEGHQEGVADGLDQAAAEFFYDREDQLFVLGQHFLGLGAGEAGGLGGEPLNIRQHDGDISCFHGFSPRSASPAP